MMDFLEKVKITARERIMAKFIKNFRNLLSKSFRNTQIIVIFHSKNYQKVHQEFENFLMDPLVSSDLNMAKVFIVSLLTEPVLKMSDNQK